jgi:4-phytase/acid phosphatase/peptide/nickel transport system substrate-binding protein
MRARLPIGARAQDYCAISRIINRDAPWFFTFQYALAKAKLKGVPKLFSGLIDVSDASLE